MKLLLKWDERVLQFYRESVNFTTRDFWEVSSDQLGCRGSGCIVGARGQWSHEHLMFLPLKTHVRRLYADVISILTFKKSSCSIQNGKLVSRPSRR
jgi:hypothetical protein